MKKYRLPKSNLVCKQPLIVLEVSELVNGLGVVDKAVYVTVQPFISLKNCWKPVQSDLTLLSMRRLAGSAIVMLVALACVRLSQSTGKCLSLC